MQRRETERAREREVEEYLYTYIYLNECKVDDNDEIVDSSEVVGRWRRSSR